MSRPPLPKSKTDFDLLEDLIRVHETVINPETSDRDLYRWWQLWNSIFFEERLHPIIVLTGLTDYGKFLGYCKAFPERYIMIQKNGIASKQDGDEKGAHHARSCKLHPFFKSLTPQQYGVALIVLHEMIHQACFEAKVDASHEGEPWALHCNAIAPELGLPLTYAPMKRTKRTLRNENGKAIRTWDGKLERVNVWVPLWKESDLRPGTRFATHDECRSFPFMAGDSMITENTVTLYEGPAVDRNNGEPVEMLPEF